MKQYSISVSGVGAASHRTAITVNSTAQQITIAAGKDTIEIIPAGTSDVYYGGSGVTSANGVPIGAGKIWSGCKAGFNVYLVCAAGQTCDVRICEYD